MIGYGICLDARRDRLNTNSSHIVPESGYDFSKLTVVFLIENHLEVRSFLDVRKEIIDSPLKPIESVDKCLTEGVAIQLLCDDIVVRDYRENHDSNIFVKDV